MSYKKIELLDNAWNAFETKIKLNIFIIAEKHLVEIQKLMTAEFVIDFNKHAIYIHTAYVHNLTLELLNLRNNSPENDTIISSCQLWATLLQYRNQYPLKIMHHKSLDAECSFNFSLRMIEGKPFGFKEIQKLNPNNIQEVNAAIHAIKHLDYLAQGNTFADLPIIEDTVLSSLLQYKDTICLLAKDVNEVIIGYCWGIMLRDIPSDTKNKVNVFYIVNLAKNPDFFDPKIKVGDALRHAIADMLEVTSDCHFLGYQHILDHKFHLTIVEGSANEHEKIHLKENKFNTNSSIEYDPFLNYVRIHIVQTQDHQYAFPTNDNLMSGLLKAFWDAAPSASDFILGGMLVYGRACFQEWTHSQFEQPLEYRIETPVSQEKHLCDFNILKKIILNAEWAQQGIAFFDNCIPHTIQKLQQLIQYDHTDYFILQKCVLNSGWALFRNTLTTLLYSTITESSNPNTAINKLIENKVTPKSWIELISQDRQEFHQTSYPGRFN